MKKLSSNILRLKRKKRVRAKVFGTAQRPRLCVFKSLKNIYAQVINDKEGKTLAAVSLKEVSAKRNDVKGAKEAGKLIAQKCAKLKIKSVIFDRGGYKYHGKIKALAEGSREGGLKF